MDCLLDTNILIRGFDHRHPMCRSVRRAAKTLYHQGTRLCLAPQNILEFWAVATRPIEQNGLGLPVPQVSALVRRFKRVFLLLPETQEVYGEWERLAVQHQVIGKKTHDARLVATMNINSVTTILTFNADDFKRYPGIRAVLPQDVIAGSS